ncbi:Uncharacterised protein [Cedecea neteri]|uniref:Uncharacterized protein n=1 Tax=Cedecea neteri TaxID=158822 RepID=A0A2X2T481_9ENTR|nr:Uncharacterised protein [Cedecea neteri]
MRKTPYLRVIFTDLLQGLLCSHLVSRISYYSTVNSKSRETQCQIKEVLMDMNIPANAFTFGNEHDLQSSGPR